jgi:hypothetical protein
MKLSAPQKVIVIFSSIVLLTLVLFPSWHQAAQSETAYRKDLGLSFVFRPPAPVAVDCYFEGCKTAPPSYFHVILYWQLLSAQLFSVLGVAIVLFWMFRPLPDGTYASLATQRVRIQFSMLMALLFPPSGKFPLAFLLLNIPRQLVHRDELWLIPTLMVLVLFFVGALVVYLLVSASLWIFKSQDDQGQGRGAALNG